MKKYYFLILIGILIISAGLFIYIGQQFYNVGYNPLLLNFKSGISETESEKPLSILLVGDIMLDRKVESLMKKNGLSYPFEKISHFLNESDGVFGNLEGPISKNPVAFSDESLKFAFSSGVVPVLASANFKILSLANNHTLNMGNSGLEETKNLLEQAKIDWVGEAWECSEKTAVKDDIVFVAFNKTFNGCNDEKVIEIVKSVKSSAPDKFLIVSMHWGEEYKTKSSPAQQELAHKIIDAGADLIFGHHPHVVQEIEQYTPPHQKFGGGGKLIFYSLGNFIFDQYFSKETREGLIVKLEIYPDKFVYNLIPIKSELSQPAVMAEEEAKIFLEELGSDSIIEIRKENKVCYKETRLDSPDASRARHGCFYVEIADTTEKQTKGLMNRENLDENRGMLFIFDNEGIYSFWMKNTLIPLDIIWLNENKEVVFIKNNAQPCEEENCPSIKPDKEAKYVLEINGGMVDKIGLKIGDYLTF